MKTGAVAHCRSRQDPVDESIKEELTRESSKGGRGLISRERALICRHSFGEVQLCCHECHLPVANRKYPSNLLQDAPHRLMVILSGDCTINDGFLIELPVQCVWFRSSFLDRYERGYAGPEPVRLADCCVAGVREKVAWPCTHSGGANEMCLTIETATLGFGREKWR